MKPESIATPAHRRHDISNSRWRLLEPYLPGQRGRWGGLAKIAVCLSMSSSAFCVPAPPGEIFHPIGETGKTRIDAFADGVTRGGRDTLPEQLITNPDFEWLMIDASHIKVHPDAAGARGGNQAIGVTKGAQ